MNSSRLPLALSLCVATAFSGLADNPELRVRSPFHLPDIPGYIILKGDFHMHTVFSDGTVWPSVRAEEAWREGLDVIAITDHIEHQAHSSDVSTNHNRSFEIARDAGKALDLLVVKGSEITRPMPPGHLNALFLTNSNPLAVSDWREAVQTACAQGAFVFWNHPGWDKQLINGQVAWYPEHTELIEGKRLHGIEVVNGPDYYPEAHRWAIEKKLTLVCNSDVHSPIGFDYAVQTGQRRSMTLLFVKERTTEAVKKALFNRQTAAYSENRLIGEERFLRPVFEKSIHLENPRIVLRGKQRGSLILSNRSDIDYELERDGTVEEILFPKKLTLAGGKTVLLDVQGTSASTSGKKVLRLPFKATNVLIGPNESMPVTFEIQVTFAQR